MRVLTAMAAGLLAAACATPLGSGPDPSAGEVPLPAHPEWRASLLHDAGATGIWTVAAYQVFPQYATPEVVGLDDEGRCIVLVSYSGKWTFKERIHDGKWLGGLAHADLDPRVVGAEIYTGGQSGNLYQLTAYPHGALDGRLIAHFPGKEIHTLVSADFDGSGGPELLVFTRPGNLYVVTPADEVGGFEVRDLGPRPGRVRDAVALPARDGEPATIAAVGRDGRLELFTLSGDTVRSATVHAEQTGIGRIALRAPEAGRPLVLYTALDDGRVLRHEREGGMEWATETIYAGPQGLRGLVAGRFHDDPDIEAVATFGYDARVRILSRTSSGWDATTIFEDRDKGHWLAVAELEGRNDTDEIIGSGYGGRIFMLARPPGYGSTDFTVEPARPAGSR